MTVPSFPRRRWWKFEVTTDSSSTEILLSVVTFLHASTVVVSRGSIRHGRQQAATMASICYAVLYCSHATTACPGLMNRSRPCDDHQLPIISHISLCGGLDIHPY